MATAKVTTIRFAPEDLAILEEVQRRTGLFAQADVLRYVLRQYAQEHEIALTAKPKRKPKK